MCLQLPLLPQCLYLGRQTPDVDEAFGFRLVEIALAKRDEILRIQGIRRNNACVDEIALVILTVPVQNSLAFFANAVSASCSGVYHLPL